MRWKIKYFEQIVWAVGKCERVYSVAEKQNNLFSVFISKKNDCWDFGSLLLQYAPPYRRVCVNIARWILQTISKWNEKSDRKVSGEHDEDEKKKRVALRRIYTIRMRHFRMPSYTTHNRCIIHICFSSNFSSMWRALKVVVLWACRMQRYGAYMNRLLLLPVYTTYFQTSQQQILNKKCHTHANSAYIQQTGGRRMVRRGERVGNLYCNI